MVGFGKPQRRRRSAALVAVAAIGLGLVSGVTAPSMAALSDPLNSFVVNGEAVDVDGSGRDVEVHGDEPSGSTDDSYSGGGPKEDDPCPSVDLSHAAPPKADLTKFWHGTDSDVPGILYLAWERKSATGTLTVDFELNHNTTSCANGVNPVREDGDLLVTYDFQGGTSIAVEVREWLSADVWGPIQAIDPIHYAAGIRADQSFGELAIDLVGAKILDTSPAAPCEVFANSFAKTRTGASTAFVTSTVKDFIKPVPTSISNCGTLTIVKDARPEGAAEFTFTATGTDMPAAPFKLVDDGDVKKNTRTFAAHPGTKTVAETVPDGLDPRRHLVHGCRCDEGVDGPGQEVRRRRPGDLGRPGHQRCHHVHVPQRQVRVDHDHQGRRPGQRPRLLVHVDRRPRRLRPR